MAHCDTCTCVINKTEMDRVYNEAAKLMNDGTIVTITNGRGHTVRGFITELSSDQYGTTAVIYPHMKLSLDAETVFWIEDGHHGF